MAKLGRIGATVRTHDGQHVVIHADVTVNTNGVFRAKITDESVKRIQPFLPDMTEGQRIKEIEAMRKDELEMKLKDFLEETVSCELVEEKEVIKYMIETRCMYCEGDKEDGYEIYPNGWWLPERLQRTDESTCDRWRRGTDEPNITEPPFGIELYCEVFCKKTFRYRTGRIAVTYETCRDEKMHHRNLNDSISWLKSLKINSRDLRTAREIDATEENAYVFVQLIKFVCKANRIMSKLKEPEGLHDFIRNSKSQIQIGPPDIGNNENGD